MLNCLSSPRCRRAALLAGLRTMAASLTANTLVGLAFITEYISQRDFSRHATVLLAANLLACALAGFLRATAKLFESERKTRRRRKRPVKQKPSL